jgi:hypothetical protein
MESAPNRSPSLRDERQRLAEQLAEVERALKILATRLEARETLATVRWPSTPGRFSDSPRDRAAR